MKLIFNIKHGNVPEYLSNNVVLVEQTHNINTRNRHNFKLPLFRTEIDKQNIFYKGLKGYNELPLEIKNCNEILVFKAKLYEFCKTLPIR